jgi:hypothetical protein
VSKRQVQVTRSPENFKFPGRLERKSAWGLRSRSDVNLKPVLRVFGCRKSENNVILSEIFKNYEFL